MSDLTYKYQESKLVELPHYLYEVCIYRLSSKCVSSLSTRYYISNKFLEVPEREIIKRFKNCTIERFITLLGAPYSFIKENNLPIYELKKKNHGKRKTAN